MFKISILLVFQFLLQINLGESQSPTPGPNLAWKVCTQIKSSSYYDTWLTLDGLDTCYLFSSATLVSWQEASDRCQSRNATLVSIHSLPMNTYLANRTKAAYDYDAHIFWIGYNSLSKRGIYKWTDGSPVGFTNVAGINSKGDTVPNSKYDQGRCVSMSSLPSKTYYSKVWQGKWFKDDCAVGHRYICQKSINTVVGPTTPPPIPGNCPKDWFRFADRKCIKYLNVSMTFNQSRDLCVKTNDGEVLSIHSEEEQNFITAYTAGKPSPYIGFRTGNTYYADWSWDSNQKLDFTNWGVSNYHYNYRDYRRCTYLVTNITQAGKWVYGNCTDHRPVICELALNTSLTTKGLTYKENKCKIPGMDNFIQYGNSCYAVFDNTNKTFSEAETYCTTLKSHLVSIVSPFEEAFLRYYIRQNGNPNIDKYWIGFQSTLISAINGSESPQLFEWTDEWPVYYTNWDKLQPKSAGLPREECVVFATNNGTWSTTFCDNDNAFICKVTNETLPNMNADKSGVCPTLFNVTDKSLMWVNVDKRSPYCYWFSADRKGYYYYSGAVQSWTDASFDCRRRNGTLASIHSEHELKLLKTKFMNISSSSYNTWIGLRSDPKGDFTWEDGSAADYFNWDPNEKIVSGDPDLTKITTPSCVEVKRSDQMWRQEACSGSKRNFYVCAVKKIYSTHPITNGGQKSSTSPKMSGGAKAGIAFGVIGGVLVVLVVGFFLMKKYRPNSPMVSSFSNHLYASRRGAPTAQPNNSEPGVSYSNSK